MEKNNAGQDAEHPRPRRVRAKPLSAGPTVFVRRLGPHHFAYLRAICEGLGLQENARRYLGTQHGHEALTAHKQTLQAVRAIARRSGERAWRLIGVVIKLPAPTHQPTLEDFIAEQDLNGWSEDEVVQIYREAYPDNPKRGKRTASRRRLLELLRRLELAHVETPRLTDRVAGWFDDRTAQRLVTAGFVTMGQLHERITLGGRWFKTMPGVGPQKARRIASHLMNLMPGDGQPLRPAFDVDRLLSPLSAGADAEALALRQGDVVILDPQRDRSSGSSRLLQASSDPEAVQAWIHLRAASAETAKTYRKEATRLLLWLKKEQGGCTLAGMSVEACKAYMDFLKDIPPGWISRVKAAPGTLGWAPFRGPLSHASQRQAVIIVASLFGWLHSVQYLPANPWAAVNKKMGDDKNTHALDTKALSEGALLEVLRFIEGTPAGPSRERMRFIVTFLEAVGLRSAEFLSATLGDLRLEPEGWVMHVHGKGAKNRQAVVPKQALEALQRYLAARGLGSVQTAAPATPLVASLQHPGQPLGYQALHEHVSRWFAKAIGASALSTKERDTLRGASTHWLRHTFGTRAIARNVPLDVIQAQMGHASIQTTTAIYGRAPIRRRVDELQKAFSGQRQGAG